MAWSHLVDLARTSEEKAEMAEKAMAPVAESQPDYPWGCCFTLTEAELEKLGVEHGDIEVGDYIDMRAFARVTSVSRHSTDDGDCCRAEFQIEKLAIENESHEEPGENGEDED